MNGLVSAMVVEPRIDTAPVPVVSVLDPEMSTLPFNVTVPSPVVNAPVPTEDITRFLFCATAMSPFNEMAPVPVLNVEDDAESA